MTVFVINIGQTVYSKHSLPLIQKLCEFNKINFFVLSQNVTQNIYNLHPSWIKLLSHKLVNDDFILCWDLDLVPTKLYELTNMLDFNNLNFCYDTSYVNENYTFNGKFKYNCGLIGIPKSHSEFMENIYHKYGESASYPSYEQYYVNDEIFDNQLIPNLLDINLNRMFAGDDDFNDNTLNAHYTWKINSNEHRIDLIEKHYNKFYKNFFD